MGNSGESTRYQTIIVKHGLSSFGLVWSGLVESGRLVCSGILYTFLSDGSAEHNDRPDRDDKPTNIQAFVAILVCNNNTKET